MKLSLDKTNDLFNQLIDILESDDKMNDYLDQMREEYYAPIALEFNTNDVGFCRILKDLGYNNPHDVLESLDVRTIYLHKPSHSYWFESLEQRKTALKDAYIRFKKNCFRKN